MGVGASGGDTELDDKIRGLARVAAAGVVDDAAIDGSQFRVRTLADIEGLHLRALLELESAGAFGPTKEAASLADLLHIDEALATVLCGDLLRLGVVQTGGMSFTATYSSAKLSTYGEEILNYLRGDDLAPEQSPLTVGSRRFSVPVAVTATR
jgi:hypothetical protein